MSDPGIDYFGAPQPGPSYFDISQFALPPEDEDEIGTLDYAKDQANYQQDIFDLLGDDISGPLIAALTMSSYGPGAANQTMFDPVVSYSPLSPEQLQNVTMGPDGTYQFGDPAVVGRIARARTLQDPVSLAIADVADGNISAGEAAAMLQRAAQEGDENVLGSIGMTNEGLPDVQSLAFLLNDVEETSLAQRAMGNTQIVADPETGMPSFVETQDSQATETLRQLGFSNPTDTYDPTMFADAGVLEQDAAAAENLARLLDLGGMSGDQAAAALEDPMARFDQINAQSDTYLQGLLDRANTPRPQAQQAPAAGGGEGGGGGAFSAPEGPLDWLDMSELSDWVGNSGALDAFGELGDAALSPFRGDPDTEYYMEQEEVAPGVFQQVQKKRKKTGASSPDTPSTPSLPEVSPGVFEDVGWIDPMKQYKDARWESILDRGKQKDAVIAGALADYNRQQMENNAVFAAQQGTAPFADEWRARQSFFGPIGMTGSLGAAQQGGSAGGTAQQAQWNPIQLTSGAGKQYQVTSPTQTRAQAFYEAMRRKGAPGGR